MFEFSKNILYYTKQKIFIVCMKPLRCTLKRLSSEVWTFTTLQFLTCIPCARILILENSVTKCKNSYKIEYFLISITENDILRGVMCGAVCNWCDSKQMYCVVCNV